MVPREPSSPRDRHRSEDGGSAGAVIGPWDGSAVGHWGKRTGWAESYAVAQHSLSPRNASCSFPASAPDPHPCPRRVPGHGRAWQTSPWARGPSQSFPSPEVRAGHRLGPAPQASPTAPATAGPGPPGPPAPGGTAEGGVGGAEGAAGARWWGQQRHTGWRPASGPGAVPLA